MRKNKMIPVSKSEVPSKYHIINSKKNISFGMRLLRFTIRYLIPTLLIASTMFLGDLFLSNRNEFNTTPDMILFVIGIIGCSFLAAILANFWFKLITANSDKEV